MSYSKCRAGVIWNFHGLFAVPEKNHSQGFFVNKLVLIGYTIFAKGHLRYVVTTIDKYPVIRANTYESLEERSDNTRCMLNSPVLICS